MTLLYRLRMLKLVVHMANPDSKELMSSLILAFNSGGWAGRPYYSLIEVVGLVGQGINMAHLGLTGYN